jgi:hypothetical protein
LFENLWYLWLGGKREERKEEEVKVREGKLFLPFGWMEERDRMWTELLSTWADNFVSLLIGRKVGKSHGGLQLLLNFGFSISYTQMHVVKVNKLEMPFVLFSSLRNQTKEIKHLFPFPCHFLCFFQTSKRRESFPFPSLSLVPYPFSFSLLSPFVTCGGGWGGEATFYPDSFYLYQNEYKSSKWLFDILSNFWIK